MPPSPTGTYVFDDLPPGTYYVREEPQPGWRQTAPASGVHIVTLGENQIVEGIDFGNQQTGDLLNRSPAFGSAPTPPSSAVVGQLLRYDSPVNDSDGDVLVFDLPTAPLSMTVHPQLGVLIWQPTLEQVGTHPVVVRVRDENGGLALQSFEINVAKPNTPHVITSSPGIQAVVGLPYQYRVSAQDADGDDVVLSAPTLLTGMTFDAATGVLNWTPTASQLGPRTVSILANDNRGGTFTQTFTVNVVGTARNQTPTITSTPRTQTQIDQNYVYLVVATDPNGDPLTYQLENPPPGMTIDAEGIVRWLPTSAQAVTHTIGIRVADGRGGSAVQSFDLQVTAQATNTAPLITSNPPLVAIHEQAYRYNAQALDFDHDPMI